MTLDKHQIDGVSEFSTKTLPAEEFEGRLLHAGYSQVGNAPAQRGRIKIWWAHSEYQRVESIYSGDKQTVITAYHVV
jgi:hypothetical protein